MTDTSDWTKENWLASHQRRVVDEWDEVSSRLTKLDAYIKGPDFPQLTTSEQVLLRVQLFYTEELEKVLSERIAAFAPTLSVR